ncbi:DNA polymerase III, delta subunit [Andreprevotia lacus DSM 23236]|jgi:DNA polymerase-3 subunit delta|uniref:DNA polymerase III subunit delta n=1 Tax=Andreprevotia lacus DSM 23236 TaxID=1121001 RepID=A0A1W1XYD0_9NEIS|nr:DNA polymerase III subunit delta [Andreprevotia lacus]SMC28969.1 DNA polymerase III, delta subunit [Andreprevotia lacus DSM 23236]
MRTDQLGRHLAGPLAPLYTLHGDEAFLTQEAAQQLRDAARRQGYTEREVMTVEPGFQWSRLGMSGNSLSLFAEQKLLELRITTGKPGVEGAKAIEAFCSDLPPDTLTIVICPKLDRTAQNAKWFQALAGAGEMIEAKAVERYQLPDWITGRLVAQGQRLGSEALDFLADRVEGNLFAAHQEIQKLGLLYPQGEISFTDVQAAVANVARFDVFQLGETLLSGDAERFVRMLDGLRAEGEAPHLVLWALSEETRALYRIGQGRSRGLPMPQLMKDNRIWGNKQRLIDGALGRVKASTLRAALAHAGEIDRLVKGVGEGDAWDELKQLGLALMGRAVVKP